MASRRSRNSTGIRNPFTVLRERFRELPWWGKSGIVLGLATACLAAIALSSIVLYYDYLARKQNLADLGKMPSRSVVYDRNGKVIGKLNGSNRVIITIDDVSPFFVDALVAREDSRFFRHNGVDYAGVGRAMIRNLKDGEFVQGASTITMQLARISYFTADKNLHRKMVEVMMARRIEAHYDKKEILTHYVNRVYFGAGLYGIERASQGYFHKKPSDLTLGEAALLAGIIRAPSRFSPVRHYEDALNERNDVLARMLAEGLASAEEVERARSEQPKVFHVDPAREQDNYALDAVRRDLDLFLEGSDLEDGGILIHTTLDMDVQGAARQALERRLTILEATPGYEHLTRASFEETFQKGTPVDTNYVQGAVVVIDNTTGGIVAVVGGRDFDHNKFNRALLARREIGSAFKPFIYATAFAGGFMPGMLIDDSPIRPLEIPGADDWSPRNADETYRGDMPAEWGLIHSRNTMTVRLGARTGLDEVVDTAKRLGIARDPPSSPQIYLGNLGATLRSLTSAYSIFPNGGILRRPHIISRVEHIGGTEVRAAPVAKTRVLSEGASWMTSDLLRDVVHEGTASQARSLGLSAPAGGKTGTTNHYTDAWFVGYSSRLTAGVWIGLDRPRTIVDRGYGSRLALPVWVDVMNAAEPFDYRGGSLEPPIPYTNVELCRESGLLVQDACRHSGQAYVQDTPYEMIPRETCQEHGWQLGSASPQADAGGGRPGFLERLLGLFR